MLDLIYTIFYISVILGAVLFFACLLLMDSNEDIVDEDNPYRGDLF